MQLKNKYNLLLTKHLPADSKFNHYSSFFQIKNFFISSIPLIRLSPLKSFLILILMHCYLDSSAQFILKGVVKDAETLHVLRGASVIADNSLSACITDENGKFEFDKLKPGLHAIVVSYVGYQMKSISINLNKNSEIEIALKLSVLDKDAALVTAYRADVNSGIDRKSTRLNSSHVSESRMPSSA